MRTYVALVLAALCSGPPMTAQGMERFHPGARNQKAREVPMTAGEAKIIVPVSASLTLGAGKHLGETHALGSTITGHKPGKEGQKRLTAEKVGQTSIIAGLHDVMNATALATTEVVDGKGMRFVRTNPLIQALAPELGALGLGEMPVGTVGQRMSVGSLGAMDQHIDTTVARGGQGNVSVWLPRALAGKVITEAKGYAARMLSGYREKRLKRGLPSEDAVAGVIQEIADGVLPHGSSEPNGFSVNLTGGRRGRLAVEAQTSDPQRVYDRALADVRQKSKETGGGFAALFVQPR